MQVLYQYTQTTEKVHDKHLNRWLISLSSELNNMWQRDYTFAETFNQS